MKGGPVALLTAAVMIGGAGGAPGGDLAARTGPPSSAVGGQGIEGHWSGTLEVPGGRLRIVFHITRAADGDLEATFDSPDQGAFGIPFDSVELSGDSVRLSVRAIGAAFEGRLSEAGDRLEGNWQQSGLSLPLALERTEEVAPPRRPQEPEAPLPYVEEEVSFDNPAAGIRLAGTLTLPPGEGPHPAAALISGSGPQNRDEMVFGHRPFLVLADDLTRRGIAVLRWDDRGVGGSTGDFGAATTEDFVGDALAAVAYLGRRPEIDPERIGLIGHSEGAIVGPLASVRSDAVAYLVLLAAPALPGDEILPQQAEAIGRASGVDGAALSAQLELQGRLIAAARDTTDEAAAAEELRAIFAEVPGLTDELAEAQIRGLLSPWMRGFLSYDPRPVLTRVSVPVLAVTGEKDLQVLPDANLPLIEDALREGGNEDYTVRELAGLNHLFQTAPTGTPAEYATIEETMAPLALEVIGDWIVERTVLP